MATPDPTPAPPPTGGTTITIPAIPPSWLQALNTILLIVTLIVGYLNHEKVTTVQEHQAINSQKIDAVKTSADEAKSEATMAKNVATEHMTKVDGKLDKLDKAAGEIKGALPPK